MTNQNDENSQQHSVEANQIEKALVWARRAASALLVDGNYAETSSPSGTTVAGGATYTPIAQITAIESGNVEIAANASFVSGDTSIPILQVSVNGGAFTPQFVWTPDQGSPSVLLTLATAALPGQTIRARFTATAGDNTVTLGNGVQSLPSAVLVLREIQPV
jgi:hypothetical protein